MAPDEYLFVFCTKLKLSLTFVIFSTKSEFSTAVQFCYTSSEQRDLISSTCNNEIGWYNDFKLYGGTKQTKNAIPIYNYEYSQPYSSILFLNDTVEGIDNLQRSPVDPTTIYIPSNCFVTSRIDDCYILIKACIKHLCARYLKWMSCCVLENLCFVVNSFL